MSCFCMQNVLVHSGSWLAGHLLARDRSRSDIHSVPTVTESQEVSGNLIIVISRQTDIKCVLYLC